MISGVENGSKVKNVGGSTIRIGTTGKVSALMMQELDSTTRPSSSNKSATTTTKSHTKRRLIQTAPVSISCGVSTRKLQRMISSDDLKVGGCSTSIRDQTRKESRPRKKEDGKRASQRFPMLEYEDSPIDKTPTRGRGRGKASASASASEKKVGKQIVEIVDLNCRDHDGDWSNPISNQLRRLSFSKLSE